MSPAAPAARSVPEAPPRRIVIVGGVAAGMSAATRLRRLDESAAITVVERGEHVSFANCGLPYYVGGVIAERDDLLLQTPASLAARFALDVRVRTEATAIDRAARTVRVRATGPDGGAAEEDLPYDALVLAPGARPVLPPISGMERALTLRDVADADALVRAVATAGGDGGPARSAVVLGAGFIGVETAENLHRRGLAVTLVELADHVLPPLDPEMAAPVAARLREAGVEVRTGVTIAELGLREALLTDGAAVAADLADLETSYAPPFGAAKDPVAMLGLVADNVLSGLTPTLQWHEFDAARAAGAGLVDVRTPAEYARGHIPGALNIPVDRLRGHLDALPDGPLIVSCQVGLRGHVAARLLLQRGREVRNLDGGYRTWSAVHGAGAVGPEPGPAPAAEEA